MHSNQDINSKSAIFYPKRANQLSPKNISTWKRNSAYSSEFETEPMHLVDEKNWGKISPDRSSNKNAKVQRVSDKYHADSNERDLLRRSHHQRQIFKNMNKRQQRSKIAQINDKLEEQVDLRKFNYDRNKQNGNGLEISKNSDRKRKHKIFERNYSNKNSKLKNNDLKKSYGSFESRSSHHRRDQIRQNHFNPAYEKITTVKIHKSQEKLLTPPPRVISNPYIQAPPYPTNYYNNPTSIRAQQQQHFRPDAPVIISYSSPMQHPSPPPSYHSRPNQVYPIINHFPPPNPHQVNPRQIYHENYSRPVTQQQLISSNILPESSQNPKSSNIKSVSRASSSNWNCNTDSQLTELINKPIIYRSMQIKDDVIQNDRKHSKERRDHIPISSSITNNRITENGKISQINKNKHTRDQFPMQEQEHHNLRDLKMKKMSSSEYSQDHTNNQFYDFSPISPSKLLTHGQNTQQNMEETPKASGNQKISNLQLSPNIKNDFEEDRFYDYGFDEDIRKTKASNQPEWVSMYKSAGNSIVSPLQQKFDQISSTIEQKSKQIKEKAPEKTSSAKISVGDRLKKMFSNADTQGKMITLILVGVGLILVFLQACK